MSIWQFLDALPALFVVMKSLVCCLAIQQDILDHSLSLCLLK